MYGLDNKLFKWTDELTADGQFDPRGAICSDLSKVV
jgi:hypothetical protein